MKILAISGSTRKESLNSHLLCTLQQWSTADMDIELYRGIAVLPIFNQDLEGDNTPEAVLQFCRKVDNADGLIISSPEYVRAIPGGLKNAIDWLVSRQEIMVKPIALVHASHRGDDMLSSLRIVLGTVSERFSEDIFLRIPIQATSNMANDSLNEYSQYKDEIADFLVQFREFINEEG